MGLIVFRFGRTSELNAERLFFCSLFFLFTLFTLVASVGAVTPPHRMRPYIGVGLIVFAKQDDIAAQDLQLQLYDEPGLFRVGLLSSSRLAGNEWVFDPLKTAPLIVSARKGDWLRVFYDDAGREAWLTLGNKGQFWVWDQFLKQQTVRLLPGLQAQYYQLFQQPGGKHLATLTPKQIFKVIKVENAWCMVMAGQAQVGWLRWHDDDNRLLFGFNR